MDGAMSTQRIRVKPWNIEHSLYALAFILALGVRLFRLGALPLSDEEARWALQALSIARGEPFAMGPQPLYVVLTGLLFALFSAGNFLARLLPALAGAGLVLLPLFHRGWLGRYASLILAFGLALDPGLLAASRMAGGPLLGLVFGLAALTAWYAQRSVATGVFGGLALLSGASILHGAIALVLAWLLSARLEMKFRPGGAMAFEVPSSEEGMQLSIMLYWLAGTVLVVGTLFLRLPQGLGALAGTIPDYLQGWVTASGVPSLRLPVALLVYQPLVLIFALVATARAWSPGSARFSYLKLLSLWAAFALLLSILYPARQVIDLVWVLVPLWALASVELVRQFSRTQNQNTFYVSAGQAALIFLLLVFAWLMVANLGNPRVLVTPEILQNALVLIFGALLMAVLSSALIGLGWSWETARRGVLWGLTTSMVVWMLSGAVGSTQLRRGAEQELWVRSPMIAQADLLLSTLSDLSAWQTGHQFAIDISVTVDAPSLHWTLRDFYSASYRNALSLESRPSTIIAYLGQESPAVAASYRGQDFAWQTYPLWQGVLPDNLPLWLAFKEAPQQHTQIILWAREDIFPDGSQVQELDAILEEFWLDSDFEDSDFE
jgi:hypothetical protein